MKNYLIIGASSGIGKELSMSLAESGHQVHGTYNENPVMHNGSGIIYQHLNVMDENLNWDSLPNEVHGLAYCPGSINLKPFKRIKPEDFVEDFKLQVEGAIKVIQGILPRLLAAEQSSILMFSTVAVQNGFNFHSQVSTSKGAIEGLTRALSAEMAPKIRVNCIAPSLTNTPLASSLLNTEAKIEANGERHPMKRIGKAEDIAEMAAFLLSDKASWITGQVLSVDGGISVIKN